MPAISDMAAAATFQANAAVFEAAFGLRAATLARQIEDFAYDEALVTLREGLAGMAPAEKS